jgi:hypothetical protein
MIFYMTFSCTHPLADGWIEVSARSELEAREKISHFFGGKWAFLYRKEDFNSEPFPLGKLGRTLE